MKTKTIHILVLMTALTFWFPGSVSADGNTPSQDELNLLELINQTRENPLGMATSLGMDSEQILKDLPELRNILIHGLLPLTFNMDLYSAASAHTYDMLASMYYSHDSLDGRTYDDRIIESGYDPLVSGESLGILAFENFVDPAEAVRVIFENIFRDELRPSRTEKRNILDPELREVGVSFCAGAFNLGGSSWNVYLTTCDFATNVNTGTIELTLLRLINQARNNPLQALEQVGGVVVDEASALEALGDEAWVLYQGLPPLAWNGQLHKAALGHNRDMIERLYYDTVSADGTTPLQRVVSTGYEALYAGETLGALAFADSADPLEDAYLIYENMVREEFNLASGVERNIFCPKVTEVGIGCEAMVFDPGDGDCFNIYVVVADFALPAEERAFLVGNVYDDRNGNGNFDPWEGIAGLKISLKPLFGPGESGTTIDTGPLGSYQAELHPFVFYELLIEGDDGNILHREFHGSQNRNQLNNILIGDN